MSSSGTNQLTQPTINGLSNLELTELTTDNLNANNIDGDFFSIQKIEADDVQVDNELELTDNGFITIGKNTPQEITITDIQVGYLDGVTSNIQTQINNSTGDLSQLQIDLDELEDDVNANQHSIGLILGVQDDLYVKTILQSASSIQQKTTFSGKLILSSLSNLDIGVEIQANTANVGILTTQQTTNTNAISNLSTQQSTNTINIQNNALSIGATSGGPTNSLFDRVKYITTTTNNTFIQHALTIQTTGASISRVQISDGEIYITKDDPELYFYRNDRPFEGPSAYLNVSSGGQFNIINYQKDRDILIGTASGSTTARIDLNSNQVFINSVDVNAKFNTNDSNITQINSDLLGLSNTATSLNIAINNNTSAITSSNVAIANNLTKITTNTNNINDLQTKVAPVGSIMFYAGSTAPDNWFICDGSLISKSANIELWGLLGNTYLAGRSPQSLSFYLPDLRQLFVTGAGDNAAYPVNATNKNVGDYNAQSIQQHAHNYEKPNNSANVGGSFAINSVWDNNTTTTATTGVITTGGGQLPSNSETRPYCMAMNYIIKK
jgi:microcystin-dependent protein